MCPLVLLACYPEAWALPDGQPDHRGDPGRAVADHPSGRHPRLHRHAGLGATWRTHPPAGAGGDHRSRRPLPDLRENTERPITLTHGTQPAGGTDPAANIVAAAKLALASPAVPRRRPVSRDGHAGERIAAVLLDGDRAGLCLAGVVPQARPGEVTGSRTN